MKKTSLYLGLLVVFFAAVYWPWFFTNHIFTWGDWGWYFPETVRQWFSVPQLWLYSASGGVDIGLTQFMPDRFFYGILAHFLTFNYFDRIVFLFPTVIFGIFSMYFLTKKITRSDEGAAISVLVYLLNSYSITLRTGHFTLAVAFALAPLVILLHAYSLEKFNLKASLLCGVISTISFFYEPRAFLLIAVVMGLYSAYYIFLIARVTFSNFIRVFISSLIPFLVLAALSLYSLVGLVFASKDISSQILSRNLFGQGYVDIQRSFTISLHSWTENIKSSRDILYIEPYFWLIPFLAIFALWLGRKNKQIIFYGIISIVGIFLAKQGGQPFINLYEWLFKHVPGFSVFREPSKFNFLIALGYSVLIGNLVAIVTKSTSLKNKTKSLIIGIIVLPFILNAPKIITGSIGKMLNPREIPADYLTYKDFIKSNYGSYRTLFVPSDSRWAYWDGNVRKMSASYYAQSEWADIINYHKQGLEYSALENVMSLFEQKFSNNLLDQYGVRYVVVPLDDKKNEDVFIYSEAKRTDYVNRVSYLSYLSPANFNSRDVLVFENKDYRPIIYWTNNKESISISQPYYPVTYSRVNATEFHIKVINVPIDKTSVALNFSEKYDSGWSLLTPKFKWYSTPTTKYKVNDVIHQETDIHTNYFVLNPQKISSSYPDAVTLNGDGTINLNLILYYKPQVYVNFSTIISCVSLFAILLYLVKTKK